MIAKRWIGGRYKTVAICDMCGRASQRNDSRPMPDLYLCNDCEPHRRTYLKGPSA